MGRRAVRLEADGGEVLGERLAEELLLGVDGREVVVGVRGARVELDRLLELLDGLVQPAAVGQLDASSCARRKARCGPSCPGSRRWSLLAFDPRGAADGRLDSDLTRSPAPEPSETRARTLARRAGVDGRVGQRACSPPIRMARYTDLTSDELAAVVRPFGLPAPDRVRPELKGPRPTRTFTSGPGGSASSCASTRGRPSTTSRFEAEVQRYLHDAHFPRAAPSRRGRRTSVRPGGGQAGDALRLRSRRGDRARGCRRGALSPRGRAARATARPGRGVHRDAREPVRPTARTRLDRSARAERRRHPAVAATLPLLRDELRRAESLPGAPRGSSTATCSSTTCSGSAIG